MSTTFCNMSVILWQNFGSIQVSCLWFWGAPLMTCRSSRWRHFLGLTGSPRWILGATACVRGCYKCLKPCPISDGAHFEQVSSSRPMKHFWGYCTQVRGHNPQVSSEPRRIRELYEPLGGTVPRCEGITRKSPTIVQADTWCIHV